MPEGFGWIWNSFFVLNSTNFMCHRMLHHAALYKCIEQYWPCRNMRGRYRMLGWLTEGTHNTLHGAHKVLWAVVMFWAVDIIAGVVDTFRCDADMCWLVQNSSVAHTCHGFQHRYIIWKIISTVFQHSYQHFWINWIIQYQTPVVVLQQWKEIWGQIRADCRIVTLVTVTAAEKISESHWKFVQLLPSTSLQTIFNVSLADVHHVQMFATWTLIFHWFMVAIWWDWEYQMSLRENLAEENFILDRPIRLNRSVKNELFFQQRGLLT